MCRIVAHEVSSALESLEEMKIGITVKLWPSLHFRACRWGCVSGRPLVGKDVKIICYADTARTIEFVLQFVR